MNAQMIRVISSPSSSTIGFSTLIFANVLLPFAIGGAGHYRRRGAGQLSVRKAMPSRCVSAVPQ